MKLRFLLGILILTFVISCADHQTEIDKTNDSSLARIIVNNELVVGVDASIPPLSFYSSTGRIIGYEIDVAQAIADRLGVRLKVVPITVETRIDELETMHIDYIASGFINNEKNAERFLLSTPYLRDALIVVVLEKFDDEARFQQFSDLRNKRIGIISDQVIVDSVLKSPLYANNGRLPYLYSQLENLLLALDYDQLEAAVMNLLTFYSKITKEKKPYRPIGEPLIITTYSYAFRKEDKELLNAVNILLNDMARDGSLPSISGKWFGADVSIVGKY